MFTNRFFDVSRPWSTGGEAGTMPAVGSATVVREHARNAMRSTSSDLTRYLGNCLLLEITSDANEITASLLLSAVERLGEFPEQLFPDKIIIKTGFESNDKQYPSLSVDALLWLQSRGIVLVGIDTPSIDAEGSVLNEAFMNTHKMVWLVNLDLKNASGGRMYFLSALPLVSSLPAPASARLGPADRSSGHEVISVPVRAVLISIDEEVG